MPLQDLVAELGVADARLGVQPRGDGVLLEHRADAVVLADLAQEVDRRQRCGPVEVVDHAGGVVALEAQEPLDLRAEVADPLADGLLGVERALGGRPRIADEAGRSADESERLVSGELEAPHEQQLHEVAQVQARRGRVEAAVVRDRVPGEQRAQRLLIGGHVHESAPDDLVPDVLEGRIVGGRGRAHEGG